MCYFTYVIHIHTIKNVSLPLILFIKVIMTDRISFLSFCTWLRFFGFLLNNFPRIFANDVKHLSPNYAFFWDILSRTNHNFPQSNQYFSVGRSLDDTITNNSTDFDNFKNNFSFKRKLPFSPTQLPTYGVSNFWKF